MGDAFYVLGGNSINLGAAGIATNTAVCCQTLTLPIVLGAATTVEVQAMSLSISGAVSGAGGWTKTGVGQLNLNNAHTYSGLTTVSAGLILINNSAGLGSTAVGTIVQSGATLALTGTVNVGAEALTLNGTGSFSGAALYTAQSITSWAGDINVASDATIGPSGDPTLAVLTLSGTLSGPGTLTKVNGGTVVYTGSSPGFTNTITIGHGRLLVNGDLGGAPVSVDREAFDVIAVLGGNGGSVFTTNVETAGGTVAPGTSPGILSSGSLTFSNSDSAFTVELNGTTVGTGYDRISVNGAVALANATLSATVGYVPALSDSFLIIDNNDSDAVSGTFNGLAEGAQFVASGRTLQITYAGGTGNDVVLTVVDLVPVELQSFEVD